MDLFSPDPPYARTGDMRTSSATVCRLTARRRPLDLVRLGTSGLPGGGCLGKDSWTMLNIVKRRWTPTGRGSWVILEALIWENISLSDPHSPWSRVPIRPIALPHAQTRELQPCDSCSTSRRSLPLDSRPHPSSLARMHRNLSVDTKPSQRLCWRGRHYV